MAICSKSKGFALDTVVEAAGVIFLTPEGLMLFVKRSGSGDHGGEWAIPGGTVEPGESMIEAAFRECREELGGDFPEDGAILPLTRATSDEGVDFMTYVDAISEEFQPDLNDEHDDYVWADPSDPPQPLHPALQPALDMLNEMFDTLGQDDDLAQDDFNPNEARKDDGKWTSGAGGGIGGGGGGAKATLAAAATPTAKQAAEAKAENPAPKSGLTGQPGKATAAKWDVKDVKDFAKTAGAGASPQYYQLLKAVPVQTFEAESTWLHVIAATKSKKYIQAVKAAAPIVAKTAYGTAHHATMNNVVDPLIEGATVAALLFCGLTNPLVVGLSVALAGYVVEGGMEKMGLGEEDSREFFLHAFRAVGGALSGLAHTEMTHALDANVSGLAVLIDALKNTPMNELHAAAKGFNIDDWTGRK